MNVLLLGPQGSGKGTQAARISADYGLAHIATGDMLRSAMTAGTPLGLQARPLYDAGKLVPDGLMIGLIRDRLDDEDAQAGFILDGFPRNMAQAEALDVTLTEIDRALDVVFVLQVTEEICLARLLRRAELEGRVDDQPEAIRTRLALYYEKTQPLIEYFRVQGKLVGIHADRSVGRVYAEIQQALDRVSGAAA